MALDASTLGEFIDPDAFMEPPSIPSSGTKLNLVLSEPQHTESHLTVLGIPPDSNVIKGDAFFALLLKDSSQADPRNTAIKGKSFFKYGTGTGDRADYIIIDWEGRRIVFLELKGGAHPLGEMINQLVGAEAVLDYIRHVGARYKRVSEDEFLGSSFKRFYVVATRTDKKGRKRPTKVNPFVGSTTISDPLRLTQVDKVYFNKLCSAAA